MDKISSSVAWRLRRAMAGKPSHEHANDGVATVMRRDTDGTVWVRLPGSTIDTPVNGTTSAACEPGQTVAYHLENGRLSVTGNASDPAAGQSTVRQVSEGVERVTTRVESVRTELVEADRVQAGEIEAAAARIGSVEADTAKIHDLTADQLSAATGYIGALTAGNVTAQNIIADKAKLAQVDVQQIDADHATIGTLDTTYATITNLDSATARIDTIESDYLKAADMTAEQARVGTLLAGKADIDDLDTATARIEDLEADHVTVSEFEAEQANIDALQANTADIATIRANAAKVQNLTAAQLEADHATIGTLDTTYMHADMSNSDVAWISNGVIANGAISSAMINDVSANKLTAGTINGSVINVTNLNADNITAGTINGQRIGEGSLSLSKLEDDVYTEAEVDAKLSTMQTEIDGAIETWTGTAVPTLQNAPASGWTTTADRDRHVGDVYFVVNAQSQQNGYNYRFTKSGSTYSWQLIKDTDITNALQRLTTAEGKITTFDSDISTLKTDTGTLTTKTESLETRMSDAEEDILDKVDTTTFNEVSNTVDQHTQTISQHTTAISNKADNSTVTAVTNRVSKNEQDISGINTTIGSLQTTVESKADGSTVTTISDKLNQTADTVDGHTSQLTSVTAKMNTVANPNLTPYFSRDKGDVYNASTNPNGYWKNISANYITALDDGWVHISASNSGTSNLFVNYFTAKTSVPKDLVASTKYTFLVETRNVTKSGNVVVFASHHYGSELHAFTSSSGYSVSGEESKYFAVTSASDLSSIACFTRGYVKVPSNGSVDMDIRISLYEGEYSGPYKPYVDQALRTNLTSLQTDYATFKQTTTEFESTIGTTIDEKIADISVGGRNYITGSATMDPAMWRVETHVTVSDGVATLNGTTADWNARLGSSLIDVTLFDDDYIRVSFEYKASVDTLVYVDIDGSSLAPGQKNTGIRTKYRPSGYTFAAKSEWTRFEWPVILKIPSGLTTGSGDVLSVYVCIWNRTDNSVLQVRHFKLEKGTKATDWTPAPEDIETELDQETALRKGTYATSSTASSTAAKVATITPAVTGFELYAGCTVTVRFNAGNTVAAPTLNVNGTGAKNIVVNGTTTPSADLVKWNAYATCTFVYSSDGHWRLTGTDQDSVRVAAAETSITQNANQIALRATKTEVFDTGNMLKDTSASDLTKVYGPSNRYWSDAAQASITPSFVAISDSPEPGITHAAQFVCDGSSTSATQRGLAFYSGESTTNIPMKEGQTYAASWWARKTSGSGRTRLAYRSGGVFVTATRAGKTDYDDELTTEWKQYTRTFTMGEVTDYNRVWFYAYFPASTAGMVQLCGFKIVPAAYATAAELKVQADSIDLKVSKNDVINQINVSTEGATIAASKVNIEGAAIFSSGRLSQTSLNNAYDAKGAASTAETNAKAYTDSQPSYVVFPTTYSYTLESWLVYAEEGYQGSWSQVKPVKVGDTVLIKGTASDTSDAVYVLVTVDAVNSSGSVTKATSHGLIDPTAGQRVQTNLDNLEIGGRNLLLWTGEGETYSAHTAVVRRWDFGAIYGTNVVTGNTVTFTKNGNGLTNGTSGIRISAMLASGSRATESDTASLSFGLDLVPGDTYTFSCDVKTSGNRVAMHAQYFNGTSRWKDAGNITEYGAPVDTDWHRYSHTFTVDSAYVSLTALGIYCELTEGVTIAAKNFKLERGNKATDWTPAPEDVAADISAAQTTANNAAPKANAVKRTQRIWYRSNSATKPSTPGTASSNWVTKEDDGNLAWTKMHVAISSTHKYIYTCEQYELASGTVGYTTVLLDNTITVIDGGNVITGTVSANAINASSGTFDTANIPNLSAAKITSGTIDAARIDASQLTIGGSGLATTQNVTDAVNDISIGGRNLVYSSGDYTGWLKDSVTTFSGDELDINVSGQTANKFYGAKQWLTRTSSDLDGSSIVVSFEVYSDAWESVTSDRDAGLASVLVQIASVTNPYGSSAQGTIGLYRYMSLSGSIHWAKLPTQENGKWLKFESIPIDIPAGLINTDLGTEFKPYLMVQPLLRRNGHVKFRRIKVETGTKASAWSPAPEDLNADISAAEANGKKEATNYISASSSGIRIASANPATQNMRMELTSSGAKMYSSDNIQRVSVDSSTGVVVGHPSKGHTVVNDAGLTVYDGNNKKRVTVLTGGLTAYDASEVDVGNFGATARLGKANSSRFLMNADSLQAYNSSNTKYFEVSESGMTFGTNSVATTQNITDAVNDISIGGRNLLAFSSVSNKSPWTLNGLTYTWESDGWITVVGTCTNTAAALGFTFGSGTQTFHYLPAGTYTLSVESENLLDGTNTYMAVQLVTRTSSDTTKYYTLYDSGSVTGVADLYVSRVSMLLQAAANGKAYNGRIRFKLERGNKATDWTPAPEDLDADVLSSGIEYIAGTQTAATNLWTGVTKETALVAGKTIAYKLPYAGTSTAATLNLTLAGGGTTGAKTVYRNNSTIGTQFAANSVIQMTYDGSYWRVTGMGSDTVNLLRFDRALKAATAITASRIICGTSSGYKNIAAGISFDLNYPLLYAGSAISAGSTGSNNYLAVQLTFSNNGTITSGAANAALYLKGTADGKTFTISSSPFLTTVVPTSDDGLAYIPLGVMSSATAGYFKSSADVYAFRNGAFQKLDTVAKYITAITDAGIRVHAKNNPTTNYAAVDADGMDVVKGGVSVAQFGETARVGKTTGSYVEIDYHSLKLKDREGGTYFHVSDLRDANGVAEMTDKFRGDGKTKTFSLALPSVNTTFSVTVSDGSGGTCTKSAAAITFSTPPTWGSTITAVYTTASNNAKAYTFGARSSGTVGAVSLAEGLANTASGGFSHAEGNGSTASGKASHAEGSSTASGTKSHAEGLSALASGNYSHAEGASTASGEESHSEGSASEASGFASHAEGNSTTASGDWSHAQGMSTMAAGESQTAIGRYNKNFSGTTALEVGNGIWSEEDDIYRLSNAMSVEWTGKLNLIDQNMPTSAPSSSYWATGNGLYIYDGEGDEITEADAIGYVRPLWRSDNGRGVQIEAQRTVNNTRTANGIGLTVNDSGDPFVTLSRVAWLRALGICSGSVAALGNTAASAYKDKSVSFGMTYSSAPHVIVGLQSDSTAGTFGRCSVSAHSVTTTGFTLRFFNGDSSNRNPSFYWIAIGTPVN